MANILVLEPWYRGSHRKWVEGWRSASRHEIKVAAGPDAGWRRSLVLGPSCFAEAITQSATEIDALVASSPIDLATVLGLLGPTISRPPTLLYMHESQIGYPPGPKGGQAQGAIINDWTAVSAADKVAVATHYHARVLIERMPPFVDELVPGAGKKLENLLSDIEILPVGIGTTDLRPCEPTGPLRVMWNHRWSFDKGPNEFVHALSVLASEGQEFGVYALGEVERSGRRARRRLLNQLKDRIVLHGHQQEGAYADALCQSDIVVSSSHHDFFGLAVTEAIAAGASPFLPNRLAYPEIVPESLHSTLLYEADLLEALRSVLSNSRQMLHQYRSATMAHVANFEWSKLAPKYDALVDDMIASRQ